MFMFCLFVVPCIRIYLPARDFLRAFALYLYMMMLSYALRLRKTELLTTPVLAMNQMLAILAQSNLLVLFYPSLNP